jgi:hypothetical protein
MRTLPLPVALIVALLSNSNPTQAKEGSWCASVNIGAGTEALNCSLQSFEVCRREVIAGNRGSCFPNPRFSNIDSGRKRAHRQQ